MTWEHRWALAQLQLFILAELGALLRKLHRAANGAAGEAAAASAAAARVSFTGAWLNVNRRGHINMPHMHDGTLSGVYYVDSGYRPGTPRPGILAPAGAETVLIMDDPRENATVLPRAELLVDAAAVTRQSVVLDGGRSGQAGQLLLWPSFVRHRVSPHTDPGHARISLSFNTIIT